MSKPPETTHFSYEWRRVATWGFANGAQTTRVNSLTIVAGGSHAKRHLSFKARVFVDIEPLKAVRRAPWDKCENSKPLVWNEFLKLPRLLSPKLTKHDMVLLGGTRLETALKTGRNWSDETAETLPPSGNSEKRHCSSPWPAKGWGLFFSGNLSMNAALYVSGGGGRLIWAGPAEIITV